MGAAARPHDVWEVRPETRLFKRKNTMTMKDFTSHITVSLIACVVAMMAFWMVEARNYVTREDCVTIVEQNSPYMQDRNLIMSEIQRANESNRELKDMVSRTNDVLSQLKLEIAVLNKTLQSMTDNRNSALLQSEYRVTSNPAK